MSTSSNSNRMGRRTRVEDYYSDEDIYSPPFPHRISPTGKRRTMPVYYEDEDDLEQVQRAMYDLDLEDRYYNGRHYRDRYVSHSTDRKRMPSYPVTESPLPWSRSRHRPVTVDDDELYYTRQRNSNTLRNNKRRNSYSMPQPVHYSPPRQRRRSIHSLPASPIHSDYEDEDYRPRRPSLVRHGSDTMVRPPPIDRRMSFQDFSSPNHQAQMMPPVFPQPMPHPITERPPSVFNNPNELGMPPVWPHLRPLPHPTNAFPLPMMGLPVLNPMMQAPSLWVPPNPWPPAPPPTNVPSPEQAKNQEEAPKEEAVVTKEISPSARTMTQEPAPPPPPPTRRKSFLSTLFGWDEDEDAKRKRKAKEYEKLGSFWCWRIISPQPQMHFESFSITNQKYILKKIAKGQGDIIFLYREKKLPGVVMIDVNQCRGCCMIQEKYFIQLEIKREQYNHAGEGGGQYTFNNPTVPNGWSVQ